MWSGPEGCGLGRGVGSGCEGCDGCGLGTRLETVIPMRTCAQVKNVYVRFLYHCYIDTEVDNKETFTKEHVWELFKSFLVDIAKVSFIVLPISTVFFQVLIISCCKCMPSDQIVDVLNSAL